MNKLEKKMVESLIDLKKNHHVIGVKAEFEAEGTRMEEALRLKEVTTRAGLELTIKIGGCEALKDMHEARTIGVNTMVAPMIESPYALKKYINATKLAFPEEERDEINFYINIETISGYNCAEEILKSKEAEDLDGIVLGRADMTGSMGLPREEVNSNLIFDMANKLVTLTNKYNKKLIIGGEVSALSLPFFRKLPENSLHKFETRKIIFDAKKALEDPNASDGILKAIGFEFMWIKNKRDYYGIIHNEDAHRLNVLEGRYKKLIEEADNIYA